MNTSPAEDRTRLPPLFTWGTRLYLSVGAFIFWDMMMGGLLEALRHLYEIFYGEDPYMYELVPMAPVYRTIFAVLEADRETLPVFCVFAVVFYWLMSRRPRLVAGLLVATAVLGGGIALLHFSHAFPYRNYRLDREDYLGFLGETLTYAVFMGLLPLILLSFAEELDRAAISQAVNWRVEQARDAAPETWRRACRHRDLIAIVGGGALRPWMAVARVLPVTLLPAVFVWTLTHKQQEIALLELESRMRMPAMATDAHLAQPEALRIRLPVDVNGGIVPGAHTLQVPPIEHRDPPGSQADWKAAVQVLRDLKAQTAGDAFVDLAIADDVFFEQIVHIVCALKEAGFREITLVDEEPCARLTRVA